MDMNMNMKGTLVIGQTGYPHHKVSFVKGQSRFDRRMRWRSGDGLSELSP